jgi:glycosyltransferase domain-containing protein
LTLELHIGHQHSLKKLVKYKIFSCHQSMSQFSNISIVIPTHNRSQYLKRSIKYWENFNINLYVVDSSEVYSKPEMLSGKYEHTPNLNFAEKIFSILEKITTPYVALCADDDFISISGLLSSIQYLERHKDFSSAQGRMISFFANNDNSVEYYPTYISRMNFKVEHPDSLTRIKNTMSQYMPFFYAVHRTESLKESFNVSREHSCARGWELGVNMISVLYGGHKTLPCFYMARDNYSLSTSVEPLVGDWMQDPKNQDDLSRWRNKFSESYAVHENQNSTNGKFAFDTALKAYLGDSNKNPKNIHDLKKALKSFAPYFLIQLWHAYKRIFRIGWYFMPPSKAEDYAKFREKFASEKGYPWSDKDAKNDWELMKRIIQEHNQGLKNE